jgi:hypothetical protein
MMDEEVGKDLQGRKSAADLSLQRIKIAWACAES